VKQLIIFITLLTVLTAKTAYSVEDFTIWKVDATVQKFNDVYFAGQDDELIIIVCDSILYRMNSSNGNYIDSLYFGKRALSSAITNDGLKVFVSLWDSIVGYDVYDFSNVLNIPKLPLSGRLIDDDINTAYLDLSISEGDKFLTYVYHEANNQSQNLYQIAIYDLELNTLEYRIDNNVNLKNESVSYFNPTMSPDLKTILIKTLKNNNSQLLFYDIEKKDFSYRINEEGQLYTNAEFIFLNEFDVNITESAFPDYYGFNVYNLKTGLLKEYFNFQNNKHRISSRIPYEINEQLFLLTLFDHDNNSTFFTFFDLQNIDTLGHFYNIQRGAKIDINKNNTFFLSYSTADIYLHDLNRYLTLTNIKENNTFYSLEISPNPSKNRNFSLNITTNKIFNADIDLYNINGQLEFNIIKNRIFTYGENVLEFSISNELSSGQYYLKIESEGGSQDVKIQF